MGCSLSGDGEGGDGGGVEMGWDWGAEGCQAFWVYHSPMKGVCLFSISCWIFEAMKLAILLCPQQFF